MEEEKEKERGMRREEMLKRWICLSKRKVRKKRKEGR